MKTTLKKNGVEADKRLSTAHSDKSKDTRLPKSLSYINLKHLKPTLYKNPYKQK